MAKEKRFDARLSDEGRAALDTLMAHYGLSAAAVFELVLRESVRRLDAGVAPAGFDPDALHEVAVEQRRLKKAARAERKAVLAETIKAVLPGPSRPATLSGQVEAVTDCSHPARWRRGPKCLQCGKRRNDAGDWVA
jgi:hypothetical protein